MTIPVLPSVIPACALRPDWSVSPVDPLRREEMDDGYLTVTRRLSRLAGMQTLVWEMTGEAFDLLVAFWADDLDAGAKYFYCPVVEGSRTCMRMVRMSGNPPWQGSSPANGVYRFAFEAELREIPLLTFGERAATEAWLLAGQDVSGIIDGLTPIVTALEALPTWR